jgi:GntR family transcriptional regulator, transcriptional repressor for pyruvate dehydrogenase complex
VSDPSSGDREKLWGPVKRSSLRDDIADRIIRNILDGHFRFGEKLPAERDLAIYLDVGRPTVREALRALAVIGMVEVRPGEGTFVVSHHGDFVARAFSWAMLLDAQTATEVVQARAAIETELAGLAATRMEPAQLEQLDRLVADMESQIGDREAFTQSDVAFHLAIADAAGNVTLSRLLGATQSLLEQWIDRALRAPQTFEVALEQHRAILDALRTGDEEQARAAMRSHVIAMGALVISASRDPLADSPAVSAN